VVERIFAEFLAGYGIFAIAERLTHDAIPCPSAHDRARNRHRCGLAWSKSAVRAILANPRYTGRQVWNRQRKDEVLLDMHDVTLGHTTVMRWNDQDQWIFTEQIVHPLIIDDETFRQAQQLPAAKDPVALRVREAGRLHAAGGAKGEADAISDLGDLDREGRPAEPAVELLSKLLVDDLGRRGHRDEPRELENHTCGGIAKLVAGFSASSV
jgi:hypothetical protein